MLRISIRIIIVRITMAVAAMEARATEVVAINHRVAATVDLVVVVAMVAVVATAVMKVDPAATAEAATTVAAAQVQAPTGELATRILASARVAAMAEVAMAEVAAAVAAITTMSRPHMAVVFSHHQGSLEPVGVELHRLHHLVATRCSLATWTSRLMRTH
jgi:hypothetical protein